MELDSIVSRTKPGLDDPTTEESDGVTCSVMTMMMMMMIMMIMIMMMIMMIMMMVSRM